MPIFSSVWSRFNFFVLFSVGGLFKKKFFKFFEKVLRKGSFLMLVGISVHNLGPMTLIDVSQICELHFEHHSKSTSLNYIIISFRIPGLIPMGWLCAIRCESRRKKIIAKRIHVSCSLKIN